MSTIIQPFWRTENVAPATVTVDAAGEYLAAMYLPIPGKTISKIGGYCTASTSGVVDIQLETITTAVPSFPSGSLVAAGASLLNQSVTASTWYNWSLTTPYTVPSSAVTQVAATIRWVSGSATFNQRWTGASGIPSARLNTGTPTASGVFPMVVIEYSDGTIQEGGYGLTARSLAAYTSATNPQEYGNRFVIPFNCICHGIVDSTRMSLASTTALSQLRIYDSNLNILTTDSETQINGLTKNALATPDTNYVYFKNPLYLIGGQTYYVTRLALTGTTNQLYYSNVTFPSLQHKQACFDDVSLCVRQNSSSPFTVDENKVEMIAPLISTTFSNKITIG